MVEHTFAGLTAWTAHHIEKLGLVVIAVQFGETWKLENYYVSGQHLAAALSAKIESVESADKRADLEIMFSKVLMLNKFARTIEYADFEAADRLAPRSPGVMDAMRSKPDSPIRDSVARSFNSYPTRGGLG